MSDRMKIRILADGTIRTETDGISAANHASAEEFLRQVRQLTGDLDAQRTPRADAPAVHTHARKETA